MSEFEDNLWRDVVREHGDDLGQVTWPPPRRRRPRPRVLAGTSAALVAAVAALVLLLGGAGTSPAFAVTTNHDGSVTLAIHRLDAIHAANVKLSSLGVRAIAVQVPAACRAAISVARFNPHRIPAGRTLVIAAWRAGHQVRLSSARIGPAGSAACLPPGRNWTAVKGPPPIAGVPAQCTVSGPPVPRPTTIYAGPGTGTTENTGTGTSESTGTAPSASTQTTASAGTGTGANQSTGTEITQGTGTATTQSPGTETTQGTGTGTTETTGTGTNGVRLHRRLPTVAIPCGYQQRIHATPQQIHRALALAQAARKHPGRVCSVTGAPAPQTATAPDIKPSEPPAVTLLRCRRPASK
jgi:hypothetical protein